MVITEDLRKQVRDLDAARRAKEDAAKKEMANAASDNEELERLWQRMNFRERHLGGWFGGDKRKVKEYRDLQSSAASRAENAAKRDIEAALLEGRTKKLIDEHLRANDPDYQALVRPRDAAMDMKTATEAFKGKIKRALKEIDDAQSMETLDLFTKNKGIAIMSSMENAEAKSAIQAAKRGAEPFQAAIDRYNGFLKGYKAPAIDAGVDDTFDLVFDLVFDGFDFMSLFTLSALSEAESKLKGALGKVREVDEIVTVQLDKADKAVLTYAKNVRSACG